MHRLAVQTARRSGTSTTTEPTEPAAAATAEPTEPIDPRDMTREELAALLDTMSDVAQARTDAAGVSFHEDTIKEALADVVLDKGMHIADLLVMAAAGTMPDGSNVLDQVLLKVNDAENPVSVNLLPIDSADAEVDAIDTDPDIPGVTSDMRRITNAMLDLDGGRSDADVAILMRFAPVNAVQAFEAWLRSGAPHDNAPFVHVLNLAMTDPGLSKASRAEFETAVYEVSVSDEDSDSEEEATVVVARAPLRRLVPVPVAGLPPPPLPTHDDLPGMFIDYDAVPNSTQRNELFALYNKHAADTSNERMTKHRLDLEAPPTVSHNSLKSVARHPCSINMMIAVLTGLTVAGVEARTLVRKRERVKSTKRAKRFAAGREKRLAGLEAKTGGGAAAAASESDSD